MLTEHEVRGYKKEVKKSTTFRGHVMTNFKRKKAITGGEVFLSVCKDCGMPVIIRTRPRPNEFYVVGEALAMHCREGWYNDV